MYLLRPSLLSVSIVRFTHMVYTWKFLFISVLSDREPVFFQFVKMFATAWCLDARLRPVYKDRYDEVCSVVTKKLLPGNE